MRWRDDQPDASEANDGDHRRARSKKTPPKCFQYVAAPDEGLVFRVRSKN